MIAAKSFRGADDSEQTLLRLFHPLIARWFLERVGRPTDVQQKAWPRIAAGEHLLITAPTGSGKTLTAFLWALHQLMTGQWSTGQTSVLYVSPLRALNYDIQRNLFSPLDELRDLFQRAGENFPEIRVLTRSGDTPQSDRRRMLRKPPEILITTPESLNLLLSSHGGRSILTSLSTVILDEIHGVFGTKRGVYLMTAVDRLVRLSGEFQRIALSATIEPLETVAAFVGGLKMEGAARSSGLCPATCERCPFGHEKGLPASCLLSAGGNRSGAGKLHLGPARQRSQEDHFREPVHPRLCEQPAALRDADPADQPG